MWLLQFLRLKSHHICNKQTEHSGSNIIITNRIYLSISLCPVWVLNFWMLWLKTSSLVCQHIFIISTSWVSIPDTYQVYCGYKPPPCHSPALSPTDRQLRRQNVTTFHFLSRTKKQTDIHTYRHTHKENYYIRSKVWASIKVTRSKPKSRQIKACRSLL